MFHTYHKALVVAGLVFCSLSSAFAYSGGSGTAGEPYQIADANDLLALAAEVNDYNKCFILTADIDLDPNLPGGQVFTRAIIAADTNSSSSGFQGTAFTGTFDGNGHKITNFTINGGSNSYLGLFGYIGNIGKVKNLGLENCAVSGYQYVGSLVGYNGGSVSDCYSTGAVGDSGSQVVGGLVGLNYGTISDCYSTGTVSGYSYVGGLVGENEGSISNCYSTGMVIGSSHYVGGLVGVNHNYYGNSGSISDCYSTGTVSGTHGVGGMVGGNGYGSISNCYSTGAVGGYSGVGGLVGDNYEGSISNCYSTGAVSGSSGSSYNIGGLVGYNDGSISDCYSTGAVSGSSGSSYIGGLVGFNYEDGSISNCYSTGAVSGTYDVGGLVGYNDGSISGCYFLITSGPNNGLGTPLTDWKMRQQSSFVGWDFVGETANGTEDIWRMCINMVNYPLLWWQFNMADFICPDSVDFADFAIMADTWLSNPEQPNWNLRCDIAQPQDDVIDILDLAVFCDNWLKSGCINCQSTCNYDGYCDPCEDPLICPDCGLLCNNNGYCDPWEGPDCPDCQTGCNYNGICEWWEDTVICSDCPMRCNHNGMCDPWEGPDCPDCQMGCNYDGMCDPWEGPDCPDCQM